MQHKSNQLLFALSVVGVAFLHFVASFVFLFVGGIMEFAPAQWIANVLMFPLILFKAPPGASYGTAESLLQLAAWVLLSLVWGYVICSLFRYFMTSRSTPRRV